jgi:hypothetical protein
VRLVGDDAAILHVVLDTNVISRRAPLSGNAERVLLDSAHNGQFVLAVPELVIRELMNKWREQAGVEAEKIRSLVDVFALRGMLASVPDASAVEARAQQVESGLRVALEHPYIETPGFPETSHEDLVRRALERRQPFDKKGQNGYRDALLWESVMKLAREHEVLLISKDYGAFAGPDKESLSPRLVDEVKERTGDAGRVELSVDLEASSRRFATENEAVRGQLERLVRVPSFRAILDEDLEEAIAEHDLGEGELGLFDFEPGVLDAGVFGIGELGLVDVCGAYAIPDGIGLADLSVHAVVDLAYFVPRDRPEWLAAGASARASRSQYSQEPDGGDGIRILPDQRVQVEIEAAIDLAPGTVERLRVRRMRRVTPDAYRRRADPLREKSSSG